MPRPCVFSRSAEADLEEIALFIATDNPRKALAFVGDMRAFCQTLVEHPARYRLCEEYGQGVRIAVFGQYLIFYRIDDMRLVVHRVLHGARHIEGLDIGP